MPPRFVGNPVRRRSSIPSDGSPRSFAAFNFEIARQNSANGGHRYLSALTTVWRAADDNSTGVSADVDFRYTQFCQRSDAGRTQPLPQPQRH